MKITIIGNSVALRVRPPESYPNNKNYTYILQEYYKTKALIENKAIGASTITDWLQKNDEVVNCFPDIYVLNLGVVDATVRETPRWVNKLANKSIDNVFSWLIKGIYHGPIAKMRPMLARIRGKKSWVSHKNFEKRFRSLVGLLLKETNAQLIMMPINIANERVEKQLPGSKRNHFGFNEVIKRIAEDYNQTFLELEDLESQTHYPDGVHFNAKGHKIVADRLKTVIDKKINKNS